MQLWEYIPVILSTGGFVAMLDDLSDGYVYRCKPVRIFLTACIAFAVTLTCWFIRVFVPVFMVCGVIYVAETLYSLRAYFIYIRSRQKTEDAPAFEPGRADRAAAPVRLSNDRVLRPVTPVEHAPERSVPLPFYSYSYSRRTAPSASIKEEETAGFRQKKSV